jgi:dihydrofolate reductase
MSKLYSYTYVSLDGVIEAPEQWSSPFFSEEMGHDLESRLESAAARVLGRVTYEEFAAFWPQQPAHTPFARLNNTIKKLVVSHTLRGAAWENTTVIGDADMAEFKATGDGDLHITGSGTLVRTWLQRGLIDEVVLVVCPELVGRGKRFFERGDTTSLSRTEVKGVPARGRGTHLRPAHHIACRPRRDDPLDAALRP